jgi:glutamyl-tRNA(Gln) amidotransferase subunit D
MFPEIRDKSNILSRLISNIWSEDLRFSHYNLMANEIKKDIDSGIDGIILTHGTDTLAYTAAALSFILENLPIPVILVGAQRSSDRPSSDSGVNLVSAVNFITNTDFSDVSICMHENTADDICDILPACKTRKMHTSRRDAFKAINDLPWARVSYQTGQIDFLKKDYNKRDTKAQINIRPLDEKVKVGILRTHTNMCPEQFSFYKDECFDGLVLEGTGLGHTPGQEINASIFEALKNLTASGCVVVMTSSTVYGRIDMNVYDKGRDLQKIGVVGNGTDMLPETAFIKLSWLLSNYSKEDAKKLMAKNLRGEISTRTLINSDIALDSKDQSA